MMIAEADERDAPIHKDNDDNLKEEETRNQPRIPEGRGSRYKIGLYNNVR